MHRTVMLAMATGALAIGGCMSAPEAFTPAERATAASPEGYTAADYDVIIDGDVVGEVKMWSSGAFVEERGDEKRTLVHASFAIENVTTEPLTLDVEGMELDSATMDSKVLDPVPPFEVVGPPRVEPGSDREVAVYFEMPRGVMPQHLDAFRVRWSLVSPRGHYTQSTPFLETHPAEQANIDAAYGYYYSPYYDPFLSGPPHRNRVIIVQPRPQPQPIRRVLHDTRIHRGQR